LGGRAVAFGAGDGGLDVYPFGPGFLPTISENGAMSAGGKKRRLTGWSNFTA
jgi:hypothetical protein